MSRDALAAATAEACGDLALQMADDAEGSTKTVLLRVTGAASDAEAAKGGPGLRQLPTREVLLVR